MKYFYKTIVLTASLAFSDGAAAQVSENTIERQCIDQAITTIEDYELMATIGDDETRYAFLTLFTDSAVVYNDLLGVAKGDWIKVDEYCKLLTNGLRNRRTTIKNIRTEGIEKVGNIWEARVSFDKSLSYVNGCGIYFSSEEVYGRDYRLTAHMQYNPQMRTCKIYKITGTVDSIKKLPDNFAVFDKKDARDDQLLYLGKNMLFNKYGQTFIKQPVEKADFEYKDPDVTVTLLYDADCNKASMAYKARPWRLRLHYDMGLGSAFKVNADNHLTEKTSSNSFGLELGYIFPSKGKLKTGIFIGAGMTDAKIELGMNQSDYYYDTNADVDGDSYTRHYHNLLLSQTAKLSEVNIPLYFNFDYRFSKVVSLYADLGAKANITLSSKVDAAEGSAYIDGVYQLYNGMVLNEEWGYNGFGQQTFTKANNVSDELDGITKTSFDALLGAGLRFNIPTTPLAVELGLNYRMGLTEMTTSERTELRLNNNSSQPVVFNTISGLNSTEKVRNMTDALESIKRAALKLTIGVTYKF